MSKAEYIPTNLDRIRVLKAYDKMTLGREHSNYRTNNARGVSSADIGKGGEPDEQTRFWSWVLCLDEPFCPAVEDDEQLITYKGRKWIVSPM